MFVADQERIIAFLSRSSTYGNDTAEVERVETHISEIFLIGDRAYKLKRAVRFPYLDFSTPDLRRSACEAEVAINRRTAPSLYLDVVPVTRDDAGEFALGGAGEAVDWLVEMRRFDQDYLFDRMALRNHLDDRTMEDTATAIAAFHEIATQHRDFGGAHATAQIIDNNAASFIEQGIGVLDGGKVTDLNAGSRRAVADCAEILDLRRSSGRVRHCHGDLHLRNICLIDGRPTLFDAIEFNRDLANIDVLYDLAFLLMDLDHRRHRGLASHVLNVYLDITGDGAGLHALPLFLSMRAAVRSHVSLAMAASITDNDAVRNLRDESRAYLDLALKYLLPSAPRLVAIGGLSGTGKSSLARELAPHLGMPGARVIRRDVCRKRLAGVESYQRLGAEGYTEEMSARTYEDVYAQVREILATGHAVIADAVFSTPEERLAIERVAENAGIPFAGVWLEASPDVMAGRVQARRGDASDATVEVLAKQQEYDLGDIRWHRVPAGGPLDETLERTLVTLGVAMACETSV